MKLVHIFMLNSLVNPLHMQSKLYTHKTVLNFDSTQSKLYTHKTVLNFDSTEICQSDLDCHVPLKCCTGFFTKYCCDIGGHTQRLKKPIRFPNITFPPMPQPMPQPIPIPIPVG